VDLIEIDTSNQTFLQFVAELEVLARDRNGKIDKLKLIGHSHAKIALLRELTHLAYNFALRTLSTTKLDSYASQPAQQGINLQIASKPD